MFSEYTDCTEFMRLISEQKLKPAAIRKYMFRKGIILTAINAKDIANEVYTILLGGKEMAEITQLISDEGNYEKSTIINIKSNAFPEGSDAFDCFADSINVLRSTSHSEYSFSQPVQSDSGLSMVMSYKKQLTGKNKLIREETRHFTINLRKADSNEILVDIRHSSSYDAQKALDLLSQITATPSDTDKCLTLSHINVDALIGKNKVRFFDELSNTRFPNWRLKTITGITVQRNSILNDDEIEEISDGEDVNGTLAGISDAVLNGSSLRSNAFVQNSLNQGYIITAMKYRYECIQEPGEFIVSISSKGNDLRVDIDKSYCDEEGKLFVQPFPRTQQDEIIRYFQQAANNVFHTLLKEQQTTSE